MGICGCEYVWAYVGVRACVDVRVGGNEGVGMGVDVSVWGVSVGWVGRGNEAMRVVK